jgi:hypothetical protein
VTEKKQTEESPFSPLFVFFGVIGEGGVLRFSWEMGVVALLPILLFAFSLQHFCETCRFVYNASRTDGHVILWKPHVSVSRGQSSILYYPQIRYRTSDGRPLEFLSAASARRAITSESDTIVPVLYDPSHPERVHVDGFAELWEPSLLFFAFAGFFVVFPLAGWAVVTRDSRRRKKETQKLSL